MLCLKLQTHQHKFGRVSQCCMLVLKLSSMYLMLMRKTWVMMRMLKEQLLPLVTFVVTFISTKISCLFCVLCSKLMVLSLTDKAGAGYVAVKGAVASFHGASWHLHEHLRSVACSVRFGQD